MNRRATCEEDFSAIPAETPPPADGGRTTVELPPGEYTFTCPDCEGDGSVQVIQLDGELLWERCDRCGSEGFLRVDEEEAAEFVELGTQPLSGPS
jgi:hypothetical protein